MLFGFGRWDISEGLKQPSVVEPVNPFERGIFDSFERSPWTSPVDHLGLVKAIRASGNPGAIQVSGAQPILSTTETTTDQRDG